jgi:hypothetical protein
VRLGPIAIVLILTTGGCGYERIVSYNPPLAGLPGAVSGIPPTGKNRAAGEGAIGAKIVIEHEDGTVELISRNGLQLLTHIHSLLTAEGDAAEEAERLFTEQILSDRTRQEFIDRGYDPAEAFRELKRREHDVMVLLAQMPMGEFTPGLYLENVGYNTFRLELPRKISDGLNWTFVDMVVEFGKWKLRWFG